MMAAAIEATKTVIDTLGPSDAIQVRALLRAAPRLERDLAYGSASPSRAWLGLWFSVGWRALG